MAIWKEQTEQRQISRKRRMRKEQPFRREMFQDQVDDSLGERLQGLVESSESEEHATSSFSSNVDSTEEVPDSSEDSSEEESREEAASQSETASSESDEDVEESDTWGVDRKDYYGADAEDVEDLSESELELAMQEEEEESRRLQERQIASLDKEDLEASQLTRLNNIASEASSLLQEKDWSTLTEDEKLRLVEKDSPELIKLLQDLQVKAGEIFDSLEPIIDNAKNFKSAYSDGMSFLELKYHLLLNYCVNIAFFMLLKSQGTSVKDHPVLDQLIELRVVMEKMKPLEEKLQYQIHKLVDIARNKNENALDNEENLEKNLKPNPASLIAVEEEEEEDDSQSDDMEQDDDVNDLQQRRYRPPRISPMTDVKSRDRSSASQSEDRKRERVEEENWKASFMEMEELPESLQNGLISQDTEKLTSLIEEEKQRQKYEEENFTRLFNEKRERKLQRKMHSLERDSILGSEFGQEFDSLVSMADHLVSSTSTDRNPDKDNYWNNEKQQQVEEQDSASVENSREEDYSSESDIEDDLSSKRKAKSRNIPRSLVPGEIPKGSRRKAQRALLENRGLTPRRKKILKNPRVKHKKRYDVAQKKRKSVIKNFSSRLYRGESSGINIRRK